eukprot:GILI01009130.1.p1 GENE.GILI01009130.1~~GILI01009130.1.p1  ORF type:complete len:323 (-),score=62.37 GILI01009130.1:129-1061(-)
MASRSWAKGDPKVLEDTEEVACICNDKKNSKRFWESHSGRKWPAVCQIFNCGNIASNGTHVRVKRILQVFILPTCDECSLRRDFTCPNGWVSCKKNAMAIRFSKLPSKEDGGKDEDDEKPAASQMQSYFEGSRPVGGLFGKRPASGGLYGQPASGGLYSTKATSVHKGFAQMGFSQTGYIEAHAAPKVSSLLGISTSYLSSASPASLAAAFAAASAEPKPKPKKAKEEKESSSKPLNAHKRGKSAEDDLSESDSDVPKKKAVRKPAKPLISKEKKSPSKPAKKAKASKAASSDSEEETIHIIVKKAKKAK